MWNGRLLGGLLVASAACMPIGISGSAHAQSSTVQSVPRVENVSTERPPEPRIMARPPIPFPHAVWVEGSWERTQDRWTWRDGHWIAPRRGMHWRDARWEPRGDGWARVSGQWL